MKVYIAEYDHPLMGLSEEAYYVVIANTKEEAMGLAMNMIAHSKREDFELTEIDQHAVGATLITSRNL